MLESIHPDIIQKINQTMNEGFEIDTNLLKPDAHLFKDLGLDSLDAIDMLVHLEEKLQIKIDGEKFKDVRTLADVYKIVGELELIKSN